LVHLVPQGEAGVKQYYAYLPSKRLYSADDKAVGDKRRAEPLIVRGIKSTWRRA
jgi:hypothetical protein